MSENLAASVRARLFNYSRETKQEFNQVLTRYAIERFLYRIGVSPYAEQFMLKPQQNMNLCDQQEKSEK